MQENGIYIRPRFKHARVANKLIIYNGKHSIKKMGQVVL